jgi:apolipoprotein N-acyltransferase
VAFRALRGRGWPLGAAALPPLLVLEWRYPLLFHSHLGDALVDRTALVQIADLGGPLLVSALAALVNVALLEGLRWRPGAPLPRAALAGALSLALAFGYGTAQIGRVSRSLAEAPALRVGVVQGNLGVLEKRRDPGVVHRGYLEQTRELLAAGALDLVVWPETVYSRGLSGPFPVSGMPIRQELRVPLLFGGVTLRPEADGRRARYNSALLVGADGVIRDVYDKNLLVPFAESLPFAERAASLAAAFPHAQAFAAGAGTPPLSLGPWRIATPICSESAERALVRRMVVEARPHLFVSLANDGWFGDSAEPWIHLAVARMRALEHKRYFVHATNTGVSAVVDPLGRIVTRSGLLTRESLRAEVRLLEGETLYGRLGDWPGWLAAAALAAGLILRRPGARA